MLAVYDKRQASIPSFKYKRHHGARIRMVFISLWLWLWRAVFVYFFSICWFGEGVCVCVCVFSFTAELRGGYRGFPHTPCLNTAPQQPPWMAPLLQLTGYMRSSLPRVPSLLKLMSIESNDAIQPSYPLLSHSLAFKLSQNRCLFKWVSSSHQVAKVLEF